MKLKERAEAIIKYQQPKFNANDFDKRKEISFYCNAQQIITLYQVIYGDMKGYICDYGLRELREWLSNCVNDFEKIYMSGDNNG